MAAMNVEFTDDAGRVLDEARGFLGSKAAEHNLVLTLLNEPRRSPRTRSVLVGGGAVMTWSGSCSSLRSLSCGHHACTAGRGRRVAACAARRAPDLPGVSGEAATAAHFADAGPSC